MGTTQKKKKAAKLKTQRATTGGIAAGAVHLFIIGVEVEIEIKIKKGRNGTAWKSEKLLSEIYKKEASGSYSKIGHEVNINISDTTESNIQYKIIKAKTWIRRNTSYKLDVLVSALVNNKYDWHEKFEFEVTFPEKSAHSISSITRHFALAPISTPTITTLCEWRIANPVEHKHEFTLEKQPISIRLETTAICHTEHLIVRALFDTLPIQPGICLGAVASLRRVAQNPPLRYDGKHYQNIQGYNDRVIAGTSTNSEHSYGHAIDIDPFDAGNWFFRVSKPAEKHAAEAIETIANSQPCLSVTTGMTITQMLQLQQDFFQRYDSLGLKGVTKELKAHNLEGQLGPLQSFRTHGFVSISTKLHDAFVSEGWEWGGAWPSRKDIQHFEYPREGISGVWSLAVLNPISST